MELVSPATVDEACRFLEAGDGAAQVIAGGTDLLVALKEGQKAPGTLVDLGGLAGLDEIAYAPETGLEIGALITLRRLVANPVIRRHYPVLAHAAAQVGTAQIQAMATLGGNLCQDSCCMYFNRPEEVRRPLPPCHKLGGRICHVVPTSPACWAPYAGDLAPVLIALGATATVAGRDGETVMPLAEIFSDDGARPVKLKPDQLITKIQCPAAGDHAGTVYLKLRPRQTLDYAVVGVAAHVRLNPVDLTCMNAKVVLTGVASSPKIVDEAEALSGTRLTDEAIAPVAAAATKLAYPVKNVVGSEPGYRRAMVTVHVAQALNDALAIAATSQEEDK
jgi:4-hydroxybenzoyl-CoA reductase subunit beta